MSMESIARFYQGTELGQTLIGQGRQEGRHELVAGMLQARFGDRPEIELLARRLAQRPDAEILGAIQAAPAIEDLLP